MSIFQSWAELTKEHDDWLALSGHLIDGSLDLDDADLPLAHEVGCWIAAQIADKAGRVTLRLEWEVAHLIRRAEALV